MYPSGFSKIYGSDEKTEPAVGIIDDIPYIENIIYLFLFIY